MSTPPDFFTTDDNEPRRDQPYGQDARGATNANDEGERRPAPPVEPDLDRRDHAGGEQRRPQLSADTGPQHRVGPGPAGERWQTPPPQDPRRPAAPHSSGLNPQAPRYQDYGFGDQGTPPRPSTEGPTPLPHNNTGQHHRPPQPNYGYPPAQRPDVPAPPPPGRPPHQVNEDEERTAIISPADLAAARDTAGFFTDTPAADPEPHAAGGSQALFSGAMGGGEPFLPTGYSSPVNAEQVVTSSRRQLETTGWRRAVAVMTFGLVKPGPSAKQLHAEEVVRRIRGALGDVFVVGFVNSKGGVGKTTMAVAAGNAIARERGDRVIVVDVDTDLGNLSARFHDTAGAKGNIEAFSAMPDSGSYSRVRVYTVQNDDRLEMLSSQNDPRSSYRLNSRDFESTMAILRRHYNVVLLDCGTSITSPLFTAIAKEVDCLVVVASQDAPGLNGAYRTQAWLAAHGLSHLRTLVVLNRTGPQKPKVDMDDVAAQFRQGTEHVVDMPYDDHLDEGGAVEFTKLGKKTQKAVMEVAGAIAHYYPSRQSQNAEGMF